MSHRLICSCGFGALLVASALSCKSRQYNQSGESTPASADALQRVLSVSTFSEIPKCGPATRSALAWVGMTKRFYSCDGSKWLDVTSALQGPQGPRGEDGATGAAGRDGAPGAAGRDGAIALIQTTRVEPSEECPAGGLSVETCTNTFEPEQLICSAGDLNYFVKRQCGAAASLVFSETVTDPAVCPAGGVRITTCQDTKMPLGICTSSDADHRVSDACNGRSGASIGVVQSEAACGSQKGTSVQLFSDTDGNGSRQPGEPLVGAPWVICDSETLEQRVKDVEEQTRALAARPIVEVSGEPPGVNCPAGGTQLTTCSPGAASSCSGATVKDVSYFCSSNSGIAVNEVRLSLSETDPTFVPVDSGPVLHLVPYTGTSLSLPVQKAAGVEWQVYRLPSPVPRLAASKLSLGTNLVYAEAGVGGIVLGAVSTAQRGEQTLQMRDGAFVDDADRPTRRFLGIVEVGSLGGAAVFFQAPAKPRLINYENRVGRTLVIAGGSVSPQDISTADSEVCWGRLRFTPYVSAHVTGGDFTATLPLSNDTGTAAKVTLVLRRNDVNAETDTVFLEPRTSLSATLARSLASDSPGVHTYEIRASASVSNVVQAPCDWRSHLAAMVWM